MAPYTCQRCTAVLAGRPNVLDLKPTEAKRAAGQRLGAMRSGRIATERDPERAGDIETLTEAPEGHSGLECPEEEAAN